MGLHQWPSEKKHQGEPGRREPVPSHVPIPRQTGAKARDFSPAATEGTAEKDSPLEGKRFELPVPQRWSVFPSRLFPPLLGRCDSDGIGVSSLATGSA